MPKKLSAVSKLILSNIDSSLSGEGLIVESLEILIKKKQKKAPNGFAYIPVNDIQNIVNELLACSSQDPSDK